MSIILFIVILMVLVFVHELGHFLAAKYAGVRVFEFAIGFPPRIFSKVWGDTRYTLGIIPFGGFVKLSGEDGEEEVDKEARSRSLAYQSPLTKIAVLAGGVLMNLVLGWLLISIGLTVGLPVSDEAVPPGATLSDPQLVVVETLAGSPAQEAGLMRGDVILKVSDAEANTVDTPAIEEFQKFVHEHGGTPIEVSYLRDGQSSRSTIQPAQTPRSDGKFVIGVGLDRVGKLVYPFPRSFIEGAKMTARLTSATAQALGEFFWKLIRSGAGLDAVTGPVGLAGMVGAAHELGWSYLLILTAVISVNLALVNIIPFPALDGGRILVVLIEWIWGRKLPQQVTLWGNLIGFGLLMLLMLVITWSDISKLILPSLF